MTNIQVVQIDIGAIDSEIAEYQSQIDKLQFEINFRKQLKQYALSHSDIKPNTIKFDKGTTTNHNTVGSISEFITEYVSRGNGYTGRQVTEAYADAKKVEYEDVRNNVFNALSRLKSAGKIRAQFDGELSKYFKNEESSQEAA